MASQKNLSVRVNVSESGEDFYLYASRSQAALDLLQLRKSRQNSFSKAEIARRVRMTPQTVHRVQTNNNLKIDFSKSPKGRNARVV